MQYKAFVYLLPFILCFTGLPLQAQDSQDPSNNACLHSELLQSRLSIQIRRKFLPRIESMYVDSYRNRRLQIDPTTWVSSTINIDFTHSIPQRTIVTVRTRFMDPSGAPVLSPPFNTVGVTTFDLLLGPIDGGIDLFGGASTYRLPDGGAFVNLQPAIILPQSGYRDARGNHILLQNGCEFISSDVATFRNAPLWHVVQDGAEAIYYPLAERPDRSHTGAIFGTLFMVDSETGRTIVSGFSAGTREQRTIFMIVDIGRN